MSGDRVILDETAGPSLAAGDSTPAGLSLERDLLRLRLISEARGNGATWATIGRTLGMTGREAKRHAHRLHSRTARQWHLQQNRES